MLTWLFSVHIQLTRFMRYSHVLFDFNLQDGEFFGVMRFYYLDDDKKVTTKCIRVSSTAKTRDVLAILIEKFRPDLRMLSHSQYAVYEVHANGGKYS